MNDHLKFDDLADKQRFVVWRNEMRGDPPKPTKVPYCPHERGRRAKADDPRTWGTREQALAAVPYVVNGHGGGIGLELGDIGDGRALGGVDLDTCRGPDGLLEPWAVAVVERLGTYAEVSPSQTGVKLFFCWDPADADRLYSAMGGQYGKAWKRGTGEHPPAIELYLSGRYFAITEDRLPDAPVQLMPVPTELLLELIRTIGPAFARPGTEKVRAAAKGRSEKALAAGSELRRQGKTYDEMVEALLAHPDADVAAWARDKGQRSGGREFKRLWDKAEPDSESGDLEAEITRLAGLPASRYELLRQATAKRLGVRTTYLDRMVAEARGPAEDAQQGRPMELPTIEPWPEPVDGATLLFGLAEFFSGHAFLPPRASIALALWSLHSFAFELFGHTPRLHVRAIAKNSGKTTVLDLLEMVVCRPLPTAHATSSVLFRVIETAKPTLLIDEADTFIRNAEEVRGIINAGHKRGGQVLRTVGDDHQPRQFSVFAPVAIAGIGDLPGTIADRSIRIEMRRALKHELPAPISKETRAEAGRLARSAARWVADNDAVLAAADPDMGELHNRMADNWRPLFAIADAAGDNWPDLARITAAVLTVVDDDTETLAIKLLADIRTVFTAEEASSAELVDKLVQMEGRPWPEMGRSRRPLTTNTLARLLRPFRIIPGNVGPEAARLRGYKRAAFADAFARNLPA